MQLLGETCPCVFFKPDWSVMLFNSSILLLIFLLLCLLGIERSLLEPLTVTVVSYIAPFSFSPFCFIYFDNVIRFAKYFCPL